MKIFSKIKTLDKIEQVWYNEKTAHLGPWPAAAIISHLLEFVKPFLKNKKEPFGS